MDKSKVLDELVKLQEKSGYSWEKCMECLRREWAESAKKPEKKPSKKGRK